MLLSLMLMLDAGCWMKAPTIDRNHLIRAPKVAHYQRYPYQFLDRNHLIKAPKVAHQRYPYQFQVRLESAKTCRGFVEVCLENKEELRKHAFLVLKSIV